MRTPLPLAVPVAGSAVRPQWSDLPGPVRTRVERALGAEVVEAQSQGSGFTPGFASRLRLADGRRVFVKATDESHAWLIVTCRDEAAKLALLPPSVPAPRLQHVLDEEIAGRVWVVLVFDDVAGRPPQRPWRLDEAGLTLRTAAGLAEALTPAPAGRVWEPLPDTLFPEPPDWTALGDPPGWAEHLDDLVALAERRGELLTGTTLCHSDLRDDNVIVGTDGTVWVCDWNRPTVGPAWNDAVCVTIAMHGDGLDAEVLLAETGLLRETDPDAVDSLLAALTAYFLLWSVKPANPTSPYLRAHQAWYATATGTWLKERRGWS